MTEKYENEMRIIANVMKKRLEEKDKKHGDSWKTASIKNLSQAVINKLEQYKECDVTNMEKVLIDIANQSMLLYLRIRPYDPFEIIETRDCDICGNNRELTIVEDGSYICRKCAIEHYDYKLKEI